MLCGRAPGNFRIPHCAAAIGFPFFFFSAFPALRLSDDGKRARRRPLRLCFLEVCHLWASSSSAFPFRLASRTGHAVNATAVRARSHPSGLGNERGDVPRSAFASGTSSSSVRLSAVLLRVQMDHVPSAKSYWPADHLLLLLLLLPSRPFDSAPANTYSHTPCLLELLFFAPPSPALHLLSVPSPPQSPTWSR